jgi:hypothetical protein
MNENLLPNLSRYFFAVILPGAVIFGPYSGDNGIIGCG